MRKKTSERKRKSIANRKLKRLNIIRISKELKEKKKELVRKMFERDGGVCVFCKKPVSVKYYQTCHIIPQEFEEFRYDINNVLLACFYHHKVGRFSIHNHPVWFTEWLKINRPEQYTYIIVKLGDIKNKIT